MLRYLSFIKVIKDKYNNRFRKNKTIADLSVASRMVTSHKPH